jgi:hypothetical protein
VFPAHILDPLQAQAIWIVTDVFAIPLPIIRLHPEQQENGTDQDIRADGQVQAIADVEIGSVAGQENPGGNGAVSVARHNDGTHVRRARRVGDGAGRDLCVAECAAECAIGEGPRGDEEGSTLAHVGNGRRQEHDVRDDHHGR